MDVIKEGINSLIHREYYKNREKLLDDAFRTMLEAQPALKTEMAIELYKAEKISLSRAAEIAVFMVPGIASGKRKEILQYFLNVSMFHPSPQ